VPNGSKKRVVLQTGKTLEEAVSKAVQKLGVPADQVDVEVMESVDRRVLFDFWGRERPLVRASVKSSKVENVEELIDLLVGILGVKADVQVDATDSYIKVSVDAGADSGIVIGKSGRTLDALEHLLWKVAKSKLGHRGAVILDVKGYRDERLQRLYREVKRAVQHTKETKDKVTLPPFPATIEREVERMVAEFDGVRYYTIGDGFYRTIVVQRKN